jgi:outer membrane protein
VDIDLLEAQIQLSLTEVSLEEAKLNLSVAKERFAGLLYLDKEFKLIYNLLMKKINIENIEPKVDSHPSVRKITQNIEIAKLNIKEAGRGFDYNLMLSGNYGNTGINFPIPEENWSIGVEINFPITDNFVTSARVASARCKMKALEETRRELKKTLHTQIKEEKEKLNSFYTQYELIMDALKYAEKNLELAETKFRQGIVRVEEVIRAQKYFTNTWVSLINILINYYLSVAKLCYLTGIDFSFFN